MSHAAITDKTDTFDIVVGDRGRIVLPAALRKKMNLKKGDHLNAHLDANNNLQIKDRKAAIQSLWGILVPYTGGKPIVDHFIADRRKEAALE